MKKDQFYIFNGNGFPSILNNHLRNAVEDVNAIGKFNYLVLCIDADESSVDERVAEVNKFIHDEQLVLNNPSKLFLVIQNRCFETWFLGNRRVFKRNPAEQLLPQFIAFYDVSADDPEQMGKMHGFETHAQFHATYLKEMLNERNIRYTKHNPGAVSDQAYLLELIARADETTHIQTFQSFVDFCNQVKLEMQ